MVPVRAGSVKPPVENRPLNSRPLPSAHLNLGTVLFERGRVDYRGVPLLYYERLL